MKVYTIATQKGGVGKTTTALALSSILQARDNRVLFIDTEPSRNASYVYRADTENKPTLYDVMFENSVSPMDAIQHTEYGDIIASDPRMSKADGLLMADGDGAFRLQDVVDDIEGYDYVVMDTGPTLNHLLFAALVATDEVIVPVTTEFFAYTGLVELDETIKRIQKRPNKGLKVAGLLMVMYRANTRLSKDVTEILPETAKRMNTKVFESKIRVCQKIPEAQARFMDLGKYAYNSNAMIDYRHFVDELTGED